MFERFFIFFSIIVIVHNTQQQYNTSLYDPLNLFVHTKNTKIGQLKLHNIKDRNLHQTNNGDDDKEKNKSKFQQDVDNYMANLYNENLCEYSFLNMLKIVDADAENKPPTQASVIQRMMCPLLVKSCCDDSYFINYNVYAAQFFDKYYSLYPKLKSFLLNVQKIDRAVWNHYIRKKNSDDNPCYQKQPEQIINAINVVNENSKEILDGYLLLLKTTFQYFRQFRCSQCGARKQRRFQLDPINHKFIIYLHPSEVYRYLTYSQKMYFYKKFLVLSNFLQCLNIQQSTADDEKASQFRIQLFEELPDYKYKVDNLDKILENKDFMKRFKEQYQLVSTPLVEPELMHEFLLETLKNKETNTKVQFVKPVTFWRTKQDVLSFVPENVEYKLTDGKDELQGFVKAEYENLIKYEADFFNDMYEKYVKKAWILCISSIFILIFQNQFNYFNKHPQKIIQTCKYFQLFFCFLQFQKHHFLQQINNINQKYILILQMYSFVNCILKRKQQFLLQNQNVLQVYTDIDDNKILKMFQQMNLIWPIKILDPYSIKDVVRSNFMFLMSQKPNTQNKFCQSELNNYVQNLQNIKKKIQLSKFKLQQLPKSLIIKKNKCFIFALLNIYKKDFILKDPNSHQGKQDNKKHICFTIKVLQKQYQKYYENLLQNIKIYQKLNTLQKQKN